MFQNEDLKLYLSNNLIRLLDSKIEILNYFKSNEGNTNNNYELILLTKDIISRIHD